MLPCLVMCAGHGTRLDPLTRLVAKAAVPLAGPTLVERVLAGLRAHGVADVVINLHHRPESITAVVGDGTHLGLRVRYSWEQPALGSAGGPRHALPLLDADPFLIVNGDTLSDVDLDALVRTHRSTGAEVTLAVVPNPAPHHYNGLVLDADGRVTGGRPRGQAEGTWHFIGVQVAGRGVFATLPDGVPAETIHGIYRDLLVARPGAIRAVPVETAFRDVGTPRDYLDAAIALAGETDAGHRTGAGRGIDPGPGPGGLLVAGEVAASARVERTVVWAGARVGDRVSLEDSVVAGAVTVPTGLSRRDVVIVPARVCRDDDAAEVIGEAAVFPMPPGAGTPRELR
ncbi:MAG: NDP-sugar synthase [Vicinamibacterales bacterium]